MIKKFDIKNKEKSSIAARIMISLLSLIVLLILLELVVRISDVYKGKGFFFKGRNIVARKIKPIKPFRTFGFNPYKTTEGKTHISSTHKEIFSLTKSKDVFRIVVFGGSTTENYNVYNKHGLHYPLVLQNLLNETADVKLVEVINASNDAYSTAHSLILLELDVISWQPDLIIVSHNINDLTAAYWKGFSYDYSHKYSNEFYSVPDLRSRYTIPNMLFQHSQLYWVAKKYFNTLNEVETTKIKRRSYGDNPPALARQIFKRNLHSIVSITKSRGIKVLFGNQPLQPSEQYFVNHWNYKPYNNVVRYPLHNEFIKHHEGYNDDIKQVALKTRSYFIDNDSVLNGRKEYFVDSVHYTLEGVQVLASNYANFISEQILTNDNVAY